MIQRHAISRSENMRRIRSKNTAPEMLVRRLVHSLGFRYRLHVSTLPGKPDLVFAGKRKIIEVRGCFWHCHPGCIDSHIPKTKIRYWKPKLAANVQRDARNESLLKSLGWSVLVVWECEAADLALVKARVVAFLGSNVTTQVLARAAISGPE